MRIKEIRKEKGITLIALIISIIIIVILATVAFNFTFGEKGLVTITPRHCTRKKKWLLL